MILLQTQTSMVFHDHSIGQKREATGRNLQRESTGDVNIEHHMRNSVQTYLYPAEGLFRLANVAGNILLKVACLHH